MRDPGPRSWLVRPPALGAAVALAVSAAACNGSVVSRGVYLETLTQKQKSKITAADGFAPIPGSYWRELWSTEVLMVEFRFANGSEVSAGLGLADYAHWSEAREDGVLCAKAQFARSLRPDSGLRGGVSLEVIADVNVTSIEMYPDRCRYSLLRLAFFCERGWLGRGMRGFVGLEEAWSTSKFVRSSNYTVYAEAVSSSLYLGLGTPSDHHGLYARVQGHLDLARAGFKFAALVGYRF